VLGAFAVKSKRSGDVEFEALPSPLQCPAVEYGSSFSRAAEVRTPGWKRVIVSGTASITPDSHDVAYVGDIDAQIDCTMNAVAAIYESRGLSLKDVSGALVYLKEERFRANWEKWLDAHPEYPREHSNAIVADVCRDEWLFEIESDAIRSFKQ
jgi:enamine deaminase RidA (YjgF/YER057c/UK114 family)